jgi:ferritin-like metal-binding protein YciE
MAETSVDVIKRYLQDAIAAEKSFETQLEGFSKEGDDTVVQSLFRQHAAETKQQYERLTARLAALGGSPSTAKSLLAHVFGLSPKAAQLGHEKEERTTQNLMMAVENSEMAMYESLATVAEAAGDTETASLARQIQAQEKETAEKIWRVLPGCAEQAFLRVTSDSGFPGTRTAAV